MRLKHGGIHKRLGVLLNKIGGYDKEFHISLLAKELNIDREIIENIFFLSHKSKRLKYINMLKNGTSVEDIFKKIKSDKEKSKLETAQTLGMLNRIIKETYYGGYL